MDSVTQLVFGSTIGHAIGGKVLGRKAIIWGAIVGTLPDLDVVLSPVLNEIEELILHRGHTHSIFWQALIAPVIALLIASIHRQLKHYWRWFFIVLLGFWTHSVVDWFTAYGTRLLIPFDSHPYSLGNLFIVDPFFTAPLLLAFVIGLFKPNKRNLAIIALVLSSSYAIVAWQTQNYVLDKTKIALKAQGINTHKILVSPTPFNVVWWRIVAIGQKNWYEGTYSVWNFKQSKFSKHNNIKFTKRSRNTHLLPLVKDSWSFEVLEEFSDGFYQLKQVNNDGEQQIHFSNLRMGFKQTYFFTYLIAEYWAGEWRLVEPAERVESGLFRAFF
jgi:inner membrane protein